MTNKVWLVIEETEQGELIVYGNGGKNGNAGNPIVRYRRTEPASPADTENWAHELVTDVAGVARSAIKKIARNEGEKVKFPWAPAAEEAGRVAAAFERMFPGHVSGEQLRAILDGREPDPTPEWAAKVVGEFKEKYPELVQLKEEAKKAARGETDWRQG